MIDNLARRNKLELLNTGFIAGSKQSLTVSSSSYSCWKIDDIIFAVLFHFSLSLNSNHAHWRMTENAQRSMNLIYFKNVFLNVVEG
jgi:hypothetical protein